MKPKIESWQDLVKNQNSQTATNPPDNTRIDSYYFIFDGSNNVIEYVNSAFSSVTGFDKKEFTIDHLLKSIHPEDFQYFLDCEERGLKFTNGLTYKDHFRYLLSYTYRIQTKSGLYIRIRQQCQAIEVDEKGHLTKTFVMHRRTDEVFNAQIDYHVFDKSLNQYVEINNLYSLSKREQEILDLIQKGLNSAEIASQLHLSKYTVDTHRKNILKKTNATNFLALTTKIAILK
jgi:DNA-binding CsgD family transcriptional regulator